MAWSVDLASLLVYIHVPIHILHNYDTIMTHLKRAFFQPGDGRSNQIITLTALHTIFVREHNRVAEILGELNRHWTDEIVFYETRQIVIAKIQHIVYNEWLPLVVGTETMERFQLNVLASGYSTDYDSEVNACVTSEFTSAAFRFGHSAVDGKFM